MKRLIILIAVLFMTSAHADKIEIKGYKTGGEWTGSNFQHWSRDAYPYDFSLTVAGHFVGYLRITPDINKQRVANIYFRLESHAYDDVKRAIQAKYRLKCSTDHLQNFAGAIWKNEQCEYRSNGDIMYINRYAGDMRSMSIFISNQKDTYDRYVAEKAKKDSDI